MHYMITGGCGFLGSNLASQLLKQGKTVTVVDNLSRVGSSSNLQWLQGLGLLDFQHCDVRDGQGLEALVRQKKPQVFFHLAGQVAMTTSLQNPALDFGTNAMGTFNVLEALRRSAPDAMLIYSSTNKVYGDLEWASYQEADTRYVLPEHPFGFGEDTPLDFRSPYGCSKGAADQYVLDYARCFGLRTVVLRHSSIFGTRQFSTYDQGWIGWFIQKAIEIREGKLPEPFSISGNGKQVRDVLFSEDLVSCYLAVVLNMDSVAGHVFNIGGGMANSLSLLELFAYLEQRLGVHMEYKVGPPRSSDQKVFVADIRKAWTLLQWQPCVGKLDGLEKMLAWVKKARDN